MEKNKEHSLEIIGDHAALGLPPAPEMDPADYLADMEGFGLTEAEKIEHLETLWNMMRTIVEMGLDIGEVDPCGQIFGSLPELPDDGPNGVKSSFSKATEARNGEEENPA